MSSMLSGLLMALLLGVTAPAANLLINGDFESTNSNVGLINSKALNALGAGQWDVYSSIPGWTTTPNFIGGVNCSPCAPAGIEVQYSGVVVNAHSANRYIELDSHRSQGIGTNSGMSQSLFLSSGTYEMSYWYIPRTRSEGDNGIKVFVGTGVTPAASDEVAALYANGARPPTNDWTQIVASFGIANPGIYNITLAAVGTDNTLGGLIDDVWLEKTGGPQEVPEPATFAAMGIGLAALVLAKRR